MEELDLRVHKYRGCILGILLGDCLGKPFMGDDKCARIVQGYFDILDQPSQNMPKKIYTCNTALTKTVARCLLDKPRLHLGYLENHTVEEDYVDPDRGYSEDLIGVLQELWSGKLEKFYDPVRKSDFMVDGKASVISVAPIALLVNSNYLEMYIDAIRLAALTGAQRLTVHGALLHCIAIRLCLTISPKEKVVHTTYIDALINNFKIVETLETPGMEDATPYQTQLHRISNILTDDLTHGNYKPIGSNEFLRGNASTALHAVPSAIYCYLRAQWPLDEIKADNPFRRCIQLAISCGGDTNSIAALVGCLAGAHYSAENISNHLIGHCEFFEGMIDIADEFSAMGGLV